MEISLKLDIRKKEAKALLEYLQSLPFVEIKTKATGAVILNLSRQVNKDLNNRPDKIYDDSSV